ncbi:MAG: hypothetical protein AAFN51_01610 [Pseudomonadota bacterium]
MPVTRLVSATTAIAVIATVLTTAHLASAPPAQAALGCCMTRVDFRSEWLRTNHSFKDCKELNADKDPDNDKLFKKSGLVWWNIRC